MLSPERRLRANRDFRRVYAQGRSYVTPMTVLYVAPQPAAADTIITGIAGETSGPCCRIGFVVSKKQGKAVVRNRIKRRLREAVRLQLPRLRAGAYDLVFVARGRLQTATWEEVRAVVAELLRRARLLQEQNAALDLALPERKRTLRAGDPVIETDSPGD